MGGNDSSFVGGVGGRPTAGMREADAVSLPAAYDIYNQYFEGGSDGHPQLRAGADPHAAAAALRGLRDTQFLMRRGGSDVGQMTEINNLVAWAEHALTDAPDGHGTQYLAESRTLDDVTGGRGGTRAAGPRHPHRPHKP